MYVIYVNHPNDRVTIHKDSCSEYRTRRSNTTKNGYWKSGFGILQQAEQFARNENKSTIRYCKKCRP